MDLQSPTDKMSGSEEASTAGRIDLLDAPETIEKKIKRAVTDTDNEVRFDVESKPGVSNLLSVLGASTATDPELLADQFDLYGPLKADDCRSGDRAPASRAAALRRARGRPGGDSSADGGRRRPCPRASPPAPSPRRTERSASAEANRSVAVGGLEHIGRRLVDGPVGPVAMVLTRPCDRPAGRCPAMVSRSAPSVSCRR